eukprot:366550-Chlamydomonas_euryale.AAC.2
MTTAAATTPCQQPGPPCVLPPVMATTAAWAPSCHRAQQPQATAWSSACAAAASAAAARALAAAALAPAAGLAAAPQVQTSRALGRAEPAMRGVTLHPRQARRLRCRRRRCPQRLAPWPWRAARHAEAAALAAALHPTGAAAAGVLALHARARALHTACHTPHGHTPHGHTPHSRAAAAAGVAAWPAAPPAVPPARCWMQTAALCGPTPKSLRQSRHCWRCGAAGPTPHLQAPGLPSPTRSHNRTRRCGPGRPAAAPTRTETQPPAPYAPPGGPSAACGNAPPHRPQARSEARLQALQPSLRRSAYALAPDPSATAVGAAAAKIEGQLRLRHRRLHCTRRRHTAARREAPTPRCSRRHRRGTPSLRRRRPHRACCYSRYSRCGRSCHGCSRERRLHHPAVLPTSPAATRGTRAPAAPAPSPPRRRRDRSRSHRHAPQRRRSRRSTAATHAAAPPSPLPARRIGASSRARPRHRRRPRPQQRRDRRGAPPSHPADQEVALLRSAPPAAAAAVAVAGAAVAAGAAGAGRSVAFGTWRAPHLATRCPLPPRARCVLRRGAALPAARCTPAAAQGQRIRRANGRRTPAPAPSPAAAVAAARKLSSVRRATAAPARRRRLKHQRVSTRRATAAAARRCASRLPPPESVQTAVVTVPAGCGPARVWTDADAPPPPHARAPLASAQWPRHSRRRHARARRRQRRVRALPHLQRPHRPVRLQPVPRPPALSPAAMRPGRRRRPLTPPTRRPHRCHRPHRRHRRQALRPPRRGRQLRAASPMGATSAAATSGRKLRAAWPAAAATSTSGESARPHAYCRSSRRTPPRQV